LRLRPFGRQFRERGATILRRHESEMADAARGRADQTLPERAWVKTILNRQSRTGALEFAGCNGMQVDEQVVQTSAAGESRFVSRFEV